MLENEYKFNRKFHDFVDKYCEEKEVTVEQAFKHEKVRQAFNRYREV